MGNKQEEEWGRRKRQEGKEEEGVRRNSRIEVFSVTQSIASDSPTTGGKTR